VDKSLRMGQEEEKESGIASQEHAEYAMYPESGEMMEDVPLSLSSGLSPWSLLWMSWSPSSTLT